MKLYEKFKTLTDIGWLFLKLGATAFGGPAVHIAMVEDEVVEKRKWMSREHYLDLIGATNLIPGPNSTEVVLHCGMHRAGLAGLLIAGISFIFPAFLMTLGLSWLYTKSGSIPDIELWLFGIKPVMVVVISFAVFKLGKKACNSKLKVMISCIVFALAISGRSEVLALLIGGILGIIISYLPTNKKRLFGISFPILPLLPEFVEKLISSKLGVLFLESLKIGSILYGSGYVLIAYVEHTFVGELGWMTPGLLLDAVAIGQLTPGPVLTTATSIGYFMAGAWGAVFATLGIFLPSFVFVLILNPLIPKLRKSKITAGFLDGINSGVMGLIVAVIIKLSGQVLINWQGVLILVFALLWMRLKPFSLGVPYLIGASSLLGWVLFLF
ncbi:chromate efflux transporter [bacterium]|jgi:chromate transporter|nr:chromate efflux transporter [bacterium]